MDTTTPALQLTLEEVLQVYLLCFDAAVAALPPFPLAYAMACPFPEVDVPVWVLWDVRDLHDPPADPLSIPFPPEYVVNAMVKKDMCDWFCFLLEDEVDKKLRDLFGASVQWLQVAPRVSFLLATRSGEHQLMIPPHSVLLVTERDGKQSIMDGTLEQYGWPSETWLQSLTDFAATRLDTSEEPYWGLAAEEEKESTWEMAAQVDGGYWGVVNERMTNLLAELDWDELRCLRTAERVDFVKKQAEDTFAGASEETWERYERRRG